MTERTKSGTQRTLCDILYYFYIQEKKIMEYYSNNNNNKNHECVECLPFRNEHLGREAHEPQLPEDQAEAKESVSCVVEIESYKYQLQPCNHLQK